MIGQTISHYRIVEKLGEGGMGIVYKAEDTKLKRTVALKFLPPALTSDPEAKERFIHEAQAAAALQHNNVCTVHEIDETKEGQIFIAMDCYDGRTLKERLHVGATPRDRDLRHASPLPIAEAIDIAIQVAQGLQKAHEKGIVHRDIKPANVMITSDGEVKLLDFGLAKLKGQALLTREGTTVGTVAYMSPEQTKGETVDHRTDIWSVGVVLYEMLTCHLPFGGEYDQAVIYSILNEEPLSVTSIRPEVPNAVGHIIARCLEKDPENRYGSVEELTKDIRQLEGALYQMSPKAAREKRKELPSIAVLPFRDMSPARDQEYFCEGIAEELINALAQIAGLSVTARTSAFQFKDKDLDVRRVGKELGVASVLEGSVRKSGTRLRITAQLINVADGYHLWSEKYDREMQDIFAVQDEISLAIVEKLKVKLLKEEKANLAKRYTDDPEAYGLYLKGRYFWYRRYEGGLQKGIECFQRAIDRDPFYALAYVGIADCYNQFGLWGFLSPKEAYPKAKAACAKALEIDDTLAEAYASLGWIHMFYDWDWAESEKAHKRAIELNPNYATVHYYYALHLGSIGRGREAIAEGKRSVDLDPLCLVHIAVLGFELYCSRQFDEAIDYLRKTLEMDSNFAVTCLFLGLSYLGKERWEEAIATFKKLASLWQGSPFTIGFLGLAYGMSGQKDEAVGMLDELDRLSQHRYVSSFYKALIYTGLRDRDQGIEYLHKAYDERESWMACLKVCAFMDPLHCDPRYDVLLRRMGFEK